MYSLCILVLLSASASLFLGSVEETSLFLNAVCKQGLALVH